MIIYHFSFSISTLFIFFFICCHQQSGLHFYQCHRCGKGFVHKSSFEMHLLAHDDIRKKKCPHCNQMFRSTSHLNRHLRIHVIYLVYLNILFLPNVFFIFLSKWIFFLDWFKAIFLSGLWSKVCPTIQYECSPAFT